MDFKGKFIVLDGPDGCGKSTQSKMLSQWIGGYGVEVVNFRDPGDTVIGEKIRDILLDKNHDKMCDNTELLLYMAARAQLWQEKIKPALQAGKCVVMDRWLSSTCAYQGYAGGLGIETVLKIAELSLERLFPDILVILDVQLETSSARMQRQLDRMELKGSQYHQQVRQGFLKLAEFIEDMEVVDASKNIDKVHQLVIDVITEKSEKQ